MVFTLLTNVVTFYVQVTIIKIEISEHKNSVRVVSRTCLHLVSSLFNANLYKLSEQHVSGS